MNKYLSLILLYNRASFKKILLISGAIPLSMILIFLLKTGSPYEAGANLLTERAFGGPWAVLVFVAANLLGVISVANSLNGKKSLKATNATTGYTMRRLCISPVSAYLTIFVYYIGVTAIFWGAATASLYFIGKAGLLMAGAPCADTGLALGILRTEIGHALIPIAHPTVIAFNAVAVLALAGQCARSCYLRWHNGTPSAGTVLLIIMMILVWTGILSDHYIFMAMTVLVPYTAFSFGDVIFREKHPKGDPFKVNKYEGIMDFDSMEFNGSVHAPEVNSMIAESDGGDLPKEPSVMQSYGRNEEPDGKKRFRITSVGRLRRRYMPLGINLEKANNFFGVCLFIGIAEHLFFFGKYIVLINKIKNSINGITIDTDMKMPYFWELQEHTYYGYLIAILMVLLIQAYWNYEYYNKKTKSVYVMKRLPDSREYIRTIWVAPAIQAVLIAAVMVLHTAVDFCLYVFATPDIALYPDYLSHILPF